MVERAMECEVEAAAEQAEVGVFVRGVAATAADSGEAWVEELRRKLQQKGHGDAERLQAVERFWTTSKGTAVRVRDVSDEGILHLHHCAVRAVTGTSGRGLPE